MALTSVAIQKAAANFLEFQKGRMLSDQNAVTEMKCDSFWRGEVAIEAQVEENGDYFWTKIRISHDCIADSSCTCVHFHREQGLCRHLAASLFHYQFYYQVGGQSSVSTSMGGRILLPEISEYDDGAAGQYRWDHLAGAPAASARHRRRNWSFVSGIKPPM